MRWLADKELGFDFAVMSIIGLLLWALTLAIGS